MAQTNRRKKNSFRKFESFLTRVILGELAGFLLMLLFAALGVGWLKWILAVAVILVSGAGCALLVSRQDHRKRRSWWMLASFAGMLLCTLVSLIAGYPAPGIYATIYYPSVSKTHWDSFYTEGVSYACPAQRRCPPHDRPAAAMQLHESDQMERNNQHHQGRNARPPSLPVSIPDFPGTNRV